MILRKQSHNIQIAVFEVVHIFDTPKRSKIKRIFIYIHIYIVMYLYVRYTKVETVNYGLCLSSDINHLPAENMQMVCLPRDVKMV